MKQLLILSFLLLSFPLFGQSKGTDVLYIWENGTRYIGEWKDGKQHGQGTYTYGKGEGEGDKYVGEFKRGYRNEYGNPLFADFFFFITGFHGFHVFSGVIINIIIFINVLLGTYERRGHYDMVEKVGLYWHFVDLVWVFVFTFFYLV